MRTELQPLEGQKPRFVATFERDGTYRSRGIVGRSILLRNLKTVKGRLLADHIWINYTAGFDATGEFARARLSSSRPGSGHTSKAISASGSKIGSHENPASITGSRSRGMS